MAPVWSGCFYKENALSSETENDSGSDSEGGDSSASGSRSSSPGSGKNQTRRSSQGSNRSGSRSPSPANSQASASSHSEAGSRKSRRDSASSGRASPRSASGSPAEDGSPNHHEKSVSRSPSQGDRKSGSGSPARESDGGRSRSESLADDKSNASERSRSPSPEVNNTRKSRSRSIGSNASRQNSGGSRSGSAESDIDSNHSKERSESPAEKSEAQDKNFEKDVTPEKKARSKSISDSEEDSGKKNAPKSKSGSPKSKSGSQSPDKTKSPKEKDGSASPQAAVRCRSRSPASDSGSDGGPKDTARKRKRAVLSDDSGSDAERKKLDTGGEKDDGDESEKDLVIDAEALFGDASDISSDEEAKKKKATKKLSDAEGEQSHGGESEAESEKARSGDEENEMDVEEKDEEDKENVPEEPPLETRIDVQIPKITTDLGKDLHFVKLPNFLSVETRPFDPSTYEDEIDEEETLDEEGRARLKLKVENTIRWREVTKQNGEFEKQSNARFVKWSDGSMSLYLGSEIFDVYKQPLQGDHNHLFIRQGTGLQGQAVFRTKLTFRPHSTESFTHRKMTMSLADRSQKTAGIKILSLVGKDPEAHRGELIKKEEERLRASVRRESRQKRIREKGANRGLSAGYLEPDRYGDADSDDEGISINAIKKQHKNKMINPRDDRSHIYSSDEDGSDIETRRAKRLDKAKALKDSDSEGSGEGDGGDGGGGGGGGGGASKSGDRSSSGED